MNIKPLKDMTRDELRGIAKALDIAGRGSMLKPQLITAIEAVRDQNAQDTKLNAEETERRLTPQVIGELKSIATNEPTQVVPNRADMRHKGFRHNPKQRGPKRAASGTLGAKHFLAGSTKRDRVAAARALAAQ